MCTDVGAYMANLKACSMCQCNSLKTLNKSTIEDNGVEIVTFERK